MPTRRRSCPKPRTNHEQICGRMFLLRRDVDLDLLGLSFWLLLQLELEHACIVAGGDVLSVHSCGQSEGTIESAEAPLDAMEILFFLLFFELALALDGKRVIFHADVQVFLFNARNFEFENHLLGVLIDVDCWRKAGSGYRVFSL